MKLVTVLAATVTAGAAIMAGACSAGHDNSAAAPSAPNLPATPAAMADAEARPSDSPLDIERLSVAPSGPATPGTASTSAPAPGSSGTSGIPGTPGTAGAPENSSRMAANPADQSLRQLGLYGQLPEGGPQRVATMDAPDNLTHVTFSFEGSDFDPTIDPSGQWLAYASTQHRQTADLYIKHVNGTTVTQLTSDTGNHVMPTFSPDGKRVAFASDRGGNFAIYMMDVQGGQPVQITNDSNDNIHPSFSHDGKQLVYASHGGQSGQWEMVVVDVDNPASKHFVGQGLFPTFSPVDNRILFQRARERGSHWFSIWTIDLVNGEGMRPTEIAASANAALITPAWSPDGRHIAFCTVMDPSPEDHSRPSQADIWIINTDGTGRVNLTHSPYTNLQPVWSSDGTIFFTSNRGKDANENIWSIRPDHALQVADQIDGGDNATARAPGGPMGMAAPAGHMARGSTAGVTPPPGGDSGAVSNNSAQQVPARTSGGDSSAMAPND